MRHVVVFGVMCAALAGCGGSKSSPTAPSTPATPTVSSLTISGLDAIKTGFYSTFSATATLSNGTSQTVTPAWSSSTTSVATIDAAGRVDALTHGQTSITAAYQGVTTTRSLRVVQNYGGSWNGIYRLKACDQSGVFRDAGWCSSLGGVGAQLPFSLNLAQTGTDRSQVAGSISFGYVMGATSGSVTSDGRLNIGGSFDVTAEGITFTIAVGGWDSQATAGETMTGRWAQNMTAIGVPGNAYQECEIVSATHTSAELAVQPAVRSVAAHKWSDLFVMLAGR
jgi:hypothetical protein